MNVKLIEKKEVATGTLELTFSAEGIDFKPGQYAILKIPLKYEDERDRRIFSLVNSPEEKDIARFATRISESGFKKTLSEMDIGTECEITATKGKFIIPEDDDLVFITGGIGITPFMSMLSHLKDNPQNKKIVMLYGNRDKSSSAYLDVLMDFEKTIPDFKLVCVMDHDESWQGEKGFIDKEKIEKYCNPKSTFMIVGPKIMVEKVSEALSSFGAEKIITENFTGY
jgi:ferredoxin-NADP reductase